MDERIIVSMTSYPKRINNVAKSIYYILNEQTRTPDEIHLWLCEEEFPNKEYDLPQDLVYIKNNSNKVFLHWLTKNTYCHKRHEIFRNLKDSCVFLLDDDVKYNSQLIETVVNKHKEIPNCIINYNCYSKHLYNGKKIIYGKDEESIGNSSLYTRWCGQSMIPSNVYPKEILLEKNTIIRDEICPICDESWVTPWLVHNNIPIYCFNFGWGEDISKNINKWDGLCKLTHQIESNGLEKRDNWLYNILMKYPQFLEDYKNKFNYNI